jgi:hypothetical protein
MTNQEPELEAKRTVRYTCTLLFSDGQSVTAEIVAASRFDDCLVSLTGACDRLPFQFDTADFVLLRAYFESFSRELRAQFREEMIGEWPPSEQLDDEPNAPEELGTTNS